MKIVKRFSSNKIITKPLTDANKDNVKNPDGLIMGLKKRTGEGLLEDDDDGTRNDISFTIQSLMMKRDSSRFVIRYKRAIDGELVDDTDHNNDDDKLDTDDKAPQHRKYLTFPKVGDGNPKQRAQANDKMRLDRVNTVGK